MTSSINNHRLRTVIQSEDRSVTPSVTPFSARLGIYVDTIYRCSDDGGKTVVGTDPSDYSFIGVFLHEVATRFSAISLFGRTLHEPIGAFVPLPSTMELVELSHYGDLRQLNQVLRATAGTVRGFWRGLAGMDCVWVFGPHPFAFPLVALAILRRKKIVLGVRQDTVVYFRARMPNRRWLPFLGAAYLLDLGFRLMSRFLKTIVVGPQIAQKYNPSRTLIMFDSVLRSAEMANELPNHDWTGTIGLITVGRLDPEKNPLLLVEAMAQLERERPGRFHLTWIGSGSMESAILQRANELGVVHRIDLRGFVPFGPEVLDMYRRAHMFVHVSFTEGVPRVLVEALGCATPIIATDVGGVRDLLADGNAGVLVPPADLGSLVAAIKQVADNPAVRNEIVSNGLAIARELALEAQAARVAEFIVR